MKDKIFKAYSGLPAWAKGVTAVVVVGGVAFLGYRLYKALNPSEKEKNNRQLLNDIDAEIASLRRRGASPSYSNSTYDLMAAQIYEGMKQCVGDDYTAVQNNMKKAKNDLDVALLIKAYGIRQLYCYGLNAGDPKDLFSAVQSELGNEWAGLTGYRVKDINNDWKKKGISYTL